VLDATPAEAAAYLEIDKDTKWVLRSQAMFVRGCPPRE